MTPMLDEHSKMTVTFRDVRGYRDARTADPTDHLVEGRDEVRPTRVVGLLAFACDASEDGRRCPLTETTSPPRSNHLCQPDSAHVMDVVWRTSSGLFRCWRPRSGDGADPPRHQVRYARYSRKAPPMRISGDGASGAWRRRLGDDLDPDRGKSLEKNQRAVERPIHARRWCHGTLLFCGTSRSSEPPRSSGYEPYSQVGSSSFAATPRDRTGPGPLRKWKRHRRSEREERHRELHVDEHASNGPTANRDLVARMLVSLLVRRDDAPATQRTASPVCFDSVESTESCDRSQLDPRGPLHCAALMTLPAVRLRPAVRPSRRDLMRWEVA